MGAFFRSSFTHVDNVIPVIKTITWLLLSRFQGNKPHRNSPEPSDLSLRNLHQHSHVWQHGCLFLAQWFCPCGQCYHQKVFKTITWLPLSRLQGNKPHRNSPEPSELCLRNLHTSTCRNSPEPSGTFRHLPAEPTPAHKGTLPNLPPEPSGTFLRNLLLRPAPAHTGASLG